MPRVSEAHLAARRQQIIDAATRCFTRRGFHQTSMQDVITEAGVSVGAFYRYFKSKNELIQAIATSKISEVAATIDDLLAQQPLPPLPAIIGAILARVESAAIVGGPGRIALQAWGEASYDPEIAKLVADIYRSIRERAARIVERAAAEGQLPPDTDPAGAGAVLFGLVQGFMLQRIVIGDPGAEQYAAGVAALLARPGR